MEVSLAALETQGATVRLLLFQQEALVAVVFLGSPQMRELVEVLVATVAVAVAAVVLL